MGKYEPPSLTSSLTKQDSVFEFEDDSSSEDSSLGSEDLLISGQDELTPDMFQTRLVSKETLTASLRKTDTCTLSEIDKGLKSLMENGDDTLADYLAKKFKKSEKDRKLLHKQLSTAGAVNIVRRATISTKTKKNSLLSSTRKRNVKKKFLIRSGSAPTPKIEKDIAWI